MPLSPLRRSLQKTPSAFLYLFLSCPIPLIHIVKVIAWYDTDFAKRYIIISWHAITISHHEIGFSMCSGVIRLCSGLFAWGRVGVLPTSAISTIIPLLANAGGKGVGMVENGRAGPSDYAISQLENAGLAVCGF